MKWIPSVRGSENGRRSPGCCAPAGGRPKRRAQTRRRDAVRLHDVASVSGMMDLLEGSALENGLGLVQAVHLDLAILQPRLEVHGDEIAPGRELLQEGERAVQGILVRAPLRLLLGDALLVRGDRTLQVRLGARELLDRGLRVGLE